MLNQIISHTPTYVWVILAVLVYRGVAAMRDQEMDVSKMFILPAIMLVLAVQDIIGKFGVSVLALACWGIAAVGTVALVHRFSATRVVAGIKPGSVMVRGSVLPLASMMSIFMLKYCASVAVVMVPTLRFDVLFTVTLCALFGVLNGYFFGRLARDLRAYQGFSHAAIIGA